MNRLDLYQLKSCNITLNRFVMNRTTSCQIVWYKIKYYHTESFRIKSDRVVLNCLVSYCILFSIESNSYKPNHGLSYPPVSSEA